MKKLESLDEFSLSNDQMRRTYGGNSIEEATTKSVSYQQCTGDCYDTVTITENDKGGDFKTCIEADCSPR